MPQMLKTPIIGPPRDCQGVQTWSRWREVMSLQYWHWFEDLERFARNHSDLHLQAWKTSIDGSARKGEWESGIFLVEAGRYERVSGNAPLWPGRGHRTGRCFGNRETAWLRLAGYSEPAVAVASLPYHDFPAGYHLSAKQVQ